MERVSVLTDRIRSLKTIAASMHEGAIHTRLIPEIDKILALPEDLTVASVGDREAVARQLREYEQTFDSLGYTLLAQLMPTVGVSAVFEVVQAADSFKSELRRSVGRKTMLDGSEVVFEQRHYDAMTRYSLSIGTPPVTDAVRDLVARTAFGKTVSQLYETIETLGCDLTDLRELLDLLRELVDSSLHYCTAAEEAAFLRDATEFANFEGGRILNRAVITEHPDRVIHLIKDHVFDKFSPGDESAVKVVEGVDGLDRHLVTRMREAPNQIFVVRVSRIPHGLFQPERGENVWRSVLGRLVLIDASERAQRSSCTVVYTLFPHVARTLRNVQTALAGRPANTQLQLRRLLERFSADALRAIREAIERKLAFLETENLSAASIEQVRKLEWLQDSLFDYLALVKLRRVVRFVENIVAGTPTTLQKLGDELQKCVAQSWMDYFYAGLDRDRYRATVVPGGGRGALALAGDYHRDRVRRLVREFAQKQLSSCESRLAGLKRDLDIPNESTDEIQAAIKQSQLRALSPTQWNGEGQDNGYRRHLARTVLYRMADVAGRVTRRTQAGLDRAAFGNITGGVAAYVKRAMADAGFSALHGTLESVVRERWAQVDRRARKSLLPARDLVRSVRRATDELRGELDPVAVAEIESILKAIEQDAFYPMLILPELSWTYGDVFPDKHFPENAIMRVPGNDRHEMDPLSLLQRLEELRYLLRLFPEVFELLCQSMLLVINSPHNPTGVVVRRETVLRLLQLASEYDITVVDDNAYHKIISRACKAREGDASVAQIYERNQGHFRNPVRILTVGATTKGLQGSGDRTGLLITNDDEATAFAQWRAAKPHMLSLYLTRLKLESGLAVKRWTKELERLSLGALDPTAAQRLTRRLREGLAQQYAHIGDEDFPVVLFETLLQGYEDLLRIERRDGSIADVSQRLSALVRRVKALRLEKAMRSDIARRVEQVRAARERALPDATDLPPDGAFYYCVRLSSSRDDRGIQPFVRTLCRHRKVDVTYAGHGYVRLSLGGELRGDDESYRQLGQAVEIYLRLLWRYWEMYEKSGRDLAALEAALIGDGGSLPDRAMNDLQPLLALGSDDGSHPATARITPDERGIVHAIEEGHSVTDTIFVEASPCQTVHQLLTSRRFRIVYRRLLRKVYRRLPALADLDFSQVDSQYGPHSCLMAYHDRQLIDALFQQLVAKMYEAWHGSRIVTVLSAVLDTAQHAEKVAALHGINRQLNELVDELLNAFEIENAGAGRGTFDVGYELLGGLRAHPRLPTYLKRIVEGCRFAGATTALNPNPVVVTGADRRIADYRYGFTRRDGAQAAAGGDSPSAQHFARRLDRFAELADLDDYLCKAVQVGPFKILLVIHKSCFHLLADELRLFPQIEEVQLRDNLDRLAWDGALIFGLPGKILGESHKTGYILERVDDRSVLPVAWVAREDATDYVGFLKKSLLTVHNELVKALGGLPVHGAMITITFKNGLRKTLVFSADSGTGKSETITAMMEQIIGGIGPATELRTIDILASDMLSLWRGEDQQLYAFGTETGDFMRLNDINEQWKAHFGDLLRRSSTSNPDHPSNARATIGGNCEIAGVLSPTRVNGFFYINNYQPARGSAVEISEDPHHLLKHVLVRGLRKNKGTSGDQPSLRAGLEFAGQSALLARFRHTIDDLLDWQRRRIDGAERMCLVFRDGAGDVFAARELVTLAFRGRRFRSGEQEKKIADVRLDVLENVFWLVADDGTRLPLSRRVYDQIYEPLTSTFCGNPFVDPEGMDQTLERFASTMVRAKVHTGVIHTELGCPGREFDGPAKAARDIVEFLLEDEEVNARFQRNKDKVHRGMRTAYAGVWEAGSNLPVELEGHNLLLLEEHESTHVAFLDGADERFSLSTPHYDFDPERGAVRGTFTPAIALPETLAVIADICSRPDFHTTLGELQVDLSAYDAIHRWNDLDELTYQVLLLHSVINLGSSETEVARFPFEVRKARHVAEMLARSRQS